MPAVAISLLIQSPYPPPITYVSMDIVCPLLQAFSTGADLAQLQIVCDIREVDQWRFLGEKERYVDRFKTYMYHIHHVINTTTNKGMLGCKTYTVPVSGQRKQESS